MKNRYFRVVLIIISILLVNACKENSTSNNNTDSNDYSYTGLTYLSDSPNKSKYHQIMAFCRNGVELPDGKIYFVGGTQGTNSYDMKVQEPELYDPATDTWKTIPNYLWTHSRYAGKLFLCSNGKLFYMRGQDIYGHSDFKCYLIYPNNSFSARQFECPYSGEEIQDADLMDNGKVIMVTAKGHVFYLDVNTENIEKTSILLPRDVDYLIDSYTLHARVTALPGANAVITGGLGISTTHQNQFGYNLKSGRFNLISARHQHYSTLLPNGKVLIVGSNGQGGVATHVTEIYDPETNKSEGINTSPINAIGYSQSFHVIDSNRVFCLANPYSTGNAFGVYNIYNIKEKTYTNDSKLSQIFSNSFIDGVTVVKLKNGDLLFNGINHSKPNSKSTFRLSYSAIK